MLEKTYSCGAHSGSKYFVREKKPIAGLLFQDVLRFPKCKVSYAYLAHLIVELVN